MKWNNLVTLFPFVAFAVLGVYMIVQPTSVVRMFERMAAESNDIFAERNRRTVAELKRLLFPIHGLPE